MSGERKFALAGMAALALVVALAFRFAVPFTASQAAGEALPGAQAETAEMQDLEQTTRVDVNHAGLEELCTLPGVGKAKAQAILDYRAEHGAFEELWEVRRVSGITQTLVDSWGEQAYLG
jgi:competence protein ComEA